MDESNVLLDVKNLRKEFAGRRGFFGKPSPALRAVDGISFRLKRGETLGVVGESGCGKSTLGRTLMRLYEPSAGEVWFDGQDICDLSFKELQRVRRKMQMVFQDPYSSLNPRFSVRDILSEPFQIHGIRRSSAAMEDGLRQLLTDVGLPDKALDRYPHEFSGGQRQRIGIARAIALDPQLIIADEPVSALDVSVQAQILNLLRGFKRQKGIAFIFISHDLAVVSHISDRVAVMYLGRVVEMARAKDLFQAPQHPYTQALLAAIPQGDGGHRRSLVQGDLPNPYEPPQGCHYHPRCPYATDLCRQSSPSLRSLEEEHEERAVACHYPLGHLSQVKE